jgi:hypothetical protein
VSTRRIEVDAARLPKWVAGFEERHGPAGAAFGPADGVDTVTLTAADGSVAELRIPFPPLGPAPDGGAPAAAATAVLAHALVPRTVLALLVRRGGYACAVLDGDRVVASKVGSRYVQGRTAAGGQSQQRFARRREKQANELVGAAVLVAQRVLLPAVADGVLLATGGDRPLLDEVLADRRLAALARLPRCPPLEIHDPKFDLVTDLPRRLRMVRIVLSET